MAIGGAILNPCRSTVGKVAETNQSKSKFLPGRLKFPLDPVSERRMKRLAVARAAHHPAQELAAPPSRRAAGYRRILGNQQAHVARVCGCCPNFSMRLKLHPSGDTAHARHWKDLAEGNRATLTVGGYLSGMHLIRRDWNLMR